MALKDLISGFARGLKVLLVEDDPVNRRLLAARLAGVFGELVLAGDGRQGLAAYHALGPQIVLTDHRMPELSGIEMMAEIRRTDPKVLFVFITSTMDTALMVRAINLGVAAIIPKPVQADNLRQAIAIVVGILENEQLQRRNLEQELALLQFRERYNEYQQEQAFRKELSFQDNDFQFRAFQDRWLTQVAYRPHDIMCGDSYSLRRLGDGGRLLFIADAMGKGLAAALTASLGVSIFNFMVDALAGRPNFDFQVFLGGFNRRIRRRLLEDEVFSFCLAWQPAADGDLEIAAFGMPPVLLAEAGRVRKLKCQNPPLSSFIEPVRTSRQELGQVRSILFHTDGLNEGECEDGRLFREHLEPAFLASTGRRQFWAAFQAMVPEPADDVTCLLLFRVDGEPLWQETRTIPCRLEAVDATCLELDGLLATRTGLGADARVEFAVAIREALLNAYEHGCLGIGAARKQELLAEGSFLDHLLELEGGREQVISVRLSVQAEGDSDLVKVTVVDEGPGFQPLPAWFEPSDSAQLRGRGLRMIQKYSDAFFFNASGNAITLLRIQNRGSHAD